MKPFYLFWALLISTISTSLHAQGWERTYDFGGGSEAGFQIAPSNDGGYYVRGQSTNALGGNQTGSFVMKISALGEEIWRRGFLDQGSQPLLKVDNLGDVLLWTEIENPTGVYTPTFYKMDSDGNQLWERTPFGATGITTRITEVYAQDDNSFTFFATELKDPLVFDEIVFLFGNISSDGIVALDTIDSASGFGAPITESNNGGYLIRNNAPNGFNIVELSATGSFIGLQFYPHFISGSIEDIFQLPNNDIVVFIRNGLGGVYSQARFDAQQNLVYLDTIVSEAGTRLHHFELLDDGFLCTGYNTPSNGLAEKTILMQTDFDANVRWKRTLSSRPGSQTSYWGTSAYGNGFIITGLTRINNGPADVYVFKTNADGMIYTNSISGTIAVDDIVNCEVDAGEMKVEDLLITAEKNNQTFITSSDVNGIFTLPVDTGDYRVSVSLPSNYWVACQNNIDVTFSGFDNQDTLDFSLQSLYDCPNLFVSGVVPNVRPCVERAAFINYCNYGTTVAEGAYLEIVLDSLMTLTSSTLPWSTMLGNTYTFDLGDIAPFECGAFSISLLLDCDAEVGLSYCMETHIYPDSLCSPTSGQWSGAFLETNGSCQSEDVLFRIQNVGGEGMNKHTSFIIVEDAVLIKHDSLRLISGEIKDVLLPRNGSTYTLIANQVANAPGNSQPITIIEACGVNNSGGFSTNFSNQFPQNDADPFIDVDCPIAVNSFDPNDKQSYPLGYRSEHYIEPNTSIEYLIRFQNTGSDTAYTVIVRDTLDDWLDATTIQRGASSHPYDFGISGEGYLQFTFQDIDLLDSSSNALASQGFVTFKIYPKTSTPLGTIIKNEAAIYFDFNEPIITNETYHKIAENFIEVLVGVTDHPHIKGIEVSVAPNPFAGKTTFEIKGYEAVEYQLAIYDAAGKLVHRAQPSGKRFEWDAGGLAKGLYFYRLTSADGFMNTGKIVVK